MLRKNTRSQRGYTLIELAIVLTIVGLIVGGILAGRDLIRVAQINSITADFQRYAAAVNGFRTKYKALPGDMFDATKIWGATVNNNCSNSNVAPVANIPGTCDGNGDGVITYGTAANKTGEAFQVWNQLAQGGFINGTYSGMAGAGMAGGKAATYLPGINAPNSKVDRVTWMIGYINNASGSNLYMFNYDYSNWMGLGSILGATWADDGFLDPQEAAGIDGKLDDAAPATGILHAMNISACTNTTDPTNRTAIYKVASKSKTACALLYNYLSTN